VEQTDIEILHTVPQRPPWRNMMLLVGLILVGMSIGNLLALLAIMAVSMLNGTPVGINELSLLLASPQQYQGAWWYLMMFQAISHFCTFLIPSVIYWRWSEQHKVEEFVRRPLPSFDIILLGILITMAFMPFNSWIIEWNSHLKLPVLLKGLEQWMQEKETSMANMTQFLTAYQSWFKLLVAITVIAIIPAIGEEVLFRGIIQRKIFHKIPNMHISIWLSAVFFSTIHFQFYGFVPRILLGAILGYLYAWSRNLWVPIFAHFINNAFITLMLFLNHRGIVTLDIRQSHTYVSWIGAFVSLGLTAFLLYRLKTFYNRTQPSI